MEIVISVVILLPLTLIGLILHDIFISTVRNRRINKVLESKFEKKCYNCEYKTSSALGEYYCESGDRIELDHTCKAFSYNRRCRKKGEFIVDRELDK